MGTPTLAPLAGPDRDAFVALMDGAFAYDPWYVALFGRGAQPRRAEFLSFLFDLSQWTGAEMVGLWEGGRLLGASILDRPEVRISGWPRVIARALAGPIGLSWRNARLLAPYLRHTRAVLPRGRTYYLTLIGVEAAARGQGVGRRLLEAVLAEVDADTTTLGVGLDTENAANVGLYERFGFFVTRAVPLDKVTVHCMFRPSS
ncbi:MAG TPA: GNAT family N-acetyltransferase [Anaerolineales bacterium]|nr:GNAT family N-acetyltransferase [Anaerolineales bacterium]